MLTCTLGSQVANWEGASAGSTGRARTTGQSKTERETLIHEVGSTIISLKIVLNDFIACTVTVAVASLNLTKRSRAKGLSFRYRLSVITYEVNKYYRDSHQSNICARGIRKHMRTGSTIYVHEG